MGHNQARALQKSVHVVGGSVNHSRIISPLSVYYEFTTTILHCNFLGTSNIE